MKRRLSGNAWELFERMFARGDEVVLVDTDGNIHFGKLTSYNTDSLFLTRYYPTKQCRLFWDEDIQFMAECGFPVRKLTGADGSASIGEEYDEKLLSDMRKWHNDPVDVIGKKKEEKWAIVFSDPFLIEGFTMQLYNSGRDTVKDWLSEQEECAMLTAKDGAQALLWELWDVYHIQRQAIA